MIKKIIAIFVIVSYVFVDLLHASPLPRASEATLASAMLPISAQEFLTSPLMLPEAKASSVVSLMPMKRFVKSFLGAQAVPILMVSMVFMISITKLPLAAAFGLSLAAGALWMILKWQDFRHAALALLFVVFFWMPVKPEVFTVDLAQSKLQVTSKFQTAPTTQYQESQDEEIPTPQSGRRRNQENDTNDITRIFTNIPFLIFVAVVVIWAFFRSRGKKKGMKINSWTPPNDDRYRSISPLLFILILTMIGHPEQQDIRDRMEAMPNSKNGVKQISQIPEALRVQAYEREFLLDRNVVLAA